MKIKEVARKTGLTEKTIRYYEHRGLVIPASTELNGRSFRDYSPEKHENRLTFRKRTHG